MIDILNVFHRRFEKWGINLPGDAVNQRSPAFFAINGWHIWYLFGADELGFFLDYYSSHRMCGDDHVRVREDGSQEDLPAYSYMRPSSSNPVEDKRLEDEFFRENQRVGILLKEKGFSNE